MPVTPRAPLRLPFRPRRNGTTRYRTRIGRRGTVAGTASSAILLAVEQPIGQNVTPTTTPAAGTDPAFFSGLVPPQSGEPEKTGSAPEASEDAIPAALRGSAGRKPAPARAQKPEEPADEADEAATAGEPGPGDDGDAAAAEKAADGAGTAEAEEAAEEPEEDVDDGKPVFEASDRRAAIIADRHGVTFTLDGETAEFGWDEIGAVEIDTPRFGKRFSVTVYTSTRRWFQSDVEAPSRTQLKQWAAELDAVLDARFDDEKPEAADEIDEPEAGAAAETAESEESAESAEPVASADEKAEAKDSASADA